MHIETPTTEPTPTTDAVFSGRFRIVYLVVKTLALYAGVFFLFYYWPLFISATMSEPGDPRAEAVAGLLMTPLGFLVLGATSGRTVALVHVALLAIVAALTYLQLPAGAFDDTRLLLESWLPSLTLVYVLGYGFGLRRQLRLFKPGAERLQP